MEILRFRFTRTKALRLISHLDLQRIFGRAFRRSGLPLAFSNGFNPHPRISFAGALPLGMITDDEYGDVVLRDSVAVDEFVMKLNTTLPYGLEIISARKITAQTPSLLSSLEKVFYEVHVYFSDEISDSEINDAIAKLMTAETYCMPKRNKKGKLINTDIRPYISDMSLKQIQDDEAIINMTLRFIEQKSVKPITLLTVLSELNHLPFILDETVMLHKIKSEYKEEF